MRPLVVVNPDELIEALLLLQEVEGSRLSGFILERQVQAFMPTVLFHLIEDGQSAQNCLD